MKGACRALVRQVLRFAPIYSGMGFIANSPPLRALCDSSEAVRVRLRDGSLIHLHPNDSVGRVAYYFGDVDRKISWVCDRVLRPGDKVLDIGANVGLVTLITARRVGSAGHVHAFEPQLDLVELIRRSLRDNEYSWVTVHPVALSDHDGVETLCVPTRSSGYATLEREDDADSRSVSVQVREVGPCLESLQAGPIRLMKIDVEGHEAAVFRGAAQFLRRSPPAVILFELAGEEEFWDREMIRVMDDLGYDFYLIPHVFLRMRLRRLARGQRPAIDARDGVAVLRGDASHEILRSLGVS